MNKSFDEEFAGFKKIDTNTPVDEQRVTSPTMQSFDDEFKGFRKVQQAQQRPIFKYVGNIEMSTRPQVKMSDGKIASVRSISFEEGGKEILVPTVSDDGKIMSDAEAIKLYYKTGKHLGKFDTISEANEYAEQLHQEEEKRVSTRPMQRPIMSPYLRGVAEGRISEAPTQPEGRKAAPWLGYAPEQALATLTQVADFPAAIMRGAKDTTRSMWQFAIGKNNADKLERISYKIPVIGKMIEAGDKYLEASGRIKNEAQALLRREAMERGGLPGAVASELVGTVQSTLMFLGAVKALGVGYGGQEGIAATLKSAAGRATFSALTAEDLSPKERLAAFGWSMAYQSTPALSSTVGKWAKSDWIAKATDIAANAGITGVQVPRMVEDAHARAEAEGKPELGGFYTTLELIKAFGSDVVFGFMTKAFREQGQPKAARTVEKLAGDSNKLLADIQKADSDLAQFMARAETQQPAGRIPDAETGRMMETQPDGTVKPVTESTELRAPELTKAEQDDLQRELAEEQGGLSPLREKPITPPPAPTQQTGKAATPLTDAGAAGVGLGRGDAGAPAPVAKDAQARADQGEPATAPLINKEAGTFKTKQEALQQITKMHDHIRNTPAMLKRVQQAGLDVGTMYTAVKDGNKWYVAATPEHVNAARALTAKEQATPAPAPTEPAFNALMDSLKKTRDATGTRLTEGEIRTTLESMAETGNKARFKDMDPVQQQAAMDAMQRMVGERSIGPGAASIDDPAFQPRMTVVKDGVRTEPEGNVTGLRNAQIERERAAYGLKPGLDRIRVSDPEAWNEAMARLEANPNAGYDLTNELAQNSRPTTKPENALLLRHLVEVNLEHNRAADATNKALASGDPVAIRDANLRYEKATQMHDTIADVLDKTGTLTAQSLQSRKMFADEEYNLATMEVKLKAAAGKRELSTEERAKLQKISEDYKKTIAELEAKVAELEKRAQADSDAEATKADIEKQATEKSKRDRKGGKEPDLEGDREKAINAIRNKVEKGDAETLADLQDPIQKLALYFEQKDIEANKGKSTLTYEKLVEQVHGVIKTILPDAAINEVRDAVSGYGQVRYPSEDPARVALSRHKSEMLKVAPLETVQANIAKLKASGVEAAKELESTKHTGFQRAQIEARARDLNKQLQSAMKEQDRIMKELGIETGDPAKRLKTALDSKKTRLQNQIEDIDRALANHKELVRNKGLPVDDDTTRALTIQRNERMAAYKEMFPDKPMTIEERIQQATKAAEKRLADWEERAKLASQGIFKSKDPLEPLPENERMSLLRRETAALKGQVESWRNLAFPKATPEERRLQSWKNRKEKMISELERRITYQDFTKKPKPEPIILDQEGFNIQKRLDEVQDRWNGMLKKERLKNRTWTQKLWDRSTEPFNVARSFMASMDLSATLRQGLILGVTHPKTAAMAVKDQLKAFASAHEAYKTMQKIINDPNYAKMKKAKIEFTEVDGKLKNMEESFMSRLASRVPGIEQSQRAYTTYLNKLRADVFNALYKTLAKAGEPNDAELIALGKYINIATGRGDLGRHALASQTFATIFWAPRLFVSRFQILAGAPMYHGTARTRKLIAGEYARFIGGMAIMYALADMMGAEIETDPRSGSFGKLKFGNTRVDPLAGLAQATTLIARLATGETKTQKGKIVAIRGDDKPAFGKGAPDYIMQFLRSKLSPLIGSAVDLAAGQNLVGEPTTPALIVKRSVVPLAFQDIYDSLVEQGIPAGTAFSMLAIFGFGVQTYDTDRDKEEKRQRGLARQIRVIEAQRARIDSTRAKQRANRTPTP